MKAHLSENDKFKICMKLVELEVEKTQSLDVRLPGIKSLANTIERADERKLADFIADEKALPNKFRAGALKVEQMVLDGKLSPEAYGLCLFDAMTSDADPWEMIRLRGWENGQLSLEDQSNLELGADKLMKEIEQVLGGTSLCVTALEKIKQSGLQNAWTEVIEALSVPTVLFMSPEDSKTYKEALSQGLHSILHEFGVEELEKVVVSSLTFSAKMEEPAKVPEMTPIVLAYIELLDSLLAKDFSS